jgi:hypothetical protein
MHITCSFTIDRFKVLTIKNDSMFSRLVMPKLMISKKCALTSFKARFKGSIPLQAIALIHTGNLSVRLYFLQFIGRNAKL